MTIDKLEPGETNTTTITLRATETNNQDYELQVNLEYDATSNPSLANHWSDPQFDYRFSAASNRIHMFFNSYPPEPWILVQYNISDNTVEVGDIIEITATLTNIGDIDAVNIKWEFNAFPGGSFIAGYNQSDDIGIIERLNASQSIQISTSLKTETYNHYFGDTIAISLDLQYTDDTNYAINPELRPYYEDSYNEHYSDTGSVSIIVYPKLEQEFGPRLKYDVSYSATGGSKGDIIFIEYSIENIGTATAYHIQPYTIYQYYGTRFYIDFIGGSDPNVNLENLNPGEKYIFNTKYQLLTNIEEGNLTLTTLLAYNPRNDGEYNQLITLPTIRLDNSENTNGLTGAWDWKNLSPEQILIIVSSAAMIIVVIESTILYKKRHLL